MSPVPASVLDLVERYAHNADRYRLPDYNETQVRREFIDPLFGALGWDVDNRRGATPQYQEVVHEATVREDPAHMGGARGGVRSPDYAFRMGPQVVYYVEAKKPSVDIHADPSPAYQLRRYAWTARLPLSVLTDFQELAIYDCRYRPAPSDAASKARVIYTRYTEYAERWDELAGILSREAVERGDFDRWAEEKKAKRGTQAVDEAFLGEIEGWRTALAQNIALRNPGIAGVRDLNYAVQKIIDRIIFLRICEDRGIEPYGQLRDAMTGHDIYARLVTLFRRADDRYNSGLFHFASASAIPSATSATGAEAADTLTPALAVDDRVLKEILDDLYYPKSPYEFSVLSADILGNVYEQFLGSVIRLTPAHRAVVEQKPEVRKAGGVYYTPRYIVDYIVAHTVGELLRDKTPAQAARLRILDPACGSGSFLLGAYDYLLRWHLEWYTSHETRQARRETYQGPGGEWRLTSDEKKRILVNNLYGVDIDPQAVEVTKLSLLLKVLEGETNDTLQLKLLQERALPDLGSNIKCGNSLIGSDFFQGRQAALFDDAEWERVNPFDRKTEFPDIMARGGFDAVIGNPPYLFGENLSLEIKADYASAYDSARGQYDTYWLFAERGLMLSSPTGYLAMIVPDSLLARDEVAVLRRLLLGVGLSALYHCGQVFEGVGISAVVYVVSRLAKPSTVQVYTRNNTEAVYRRDCCCSEFAADPAARFLIHADSEEQAVLTRVDRAGVALGSYIDISRGEELGKKNVLSEGPVPILVGEDVKRYWIAQPSRFVRRAEKPSHLYRAPKLVMVKTGKGIVASLEAQGTVTMQSLYNMQMLPNVRQDGRFLLGLLNSRLLSFYAAKKFTSYKKLFPQFNQSTVQLLPIRTIDFSNPADVVRHDRMVALVERMLALHRDLATAEAGAPGRVTLLQRQIAATDAEIDALVYELYGLSAEEIRIVEEGTKR